MANSVLFPKQSEVLIQLLKEDQKEWKQFSRKYFKAPDKTDLKGERTSLRQRVKARAEKMREVMSEVGEPSLSNIGKEASIAISVLASHSSLADTEYVLKEFNQLFDKKRIDVHFESIPPLTDFVLLAKRKSQLFGTIWFFDKDMRPFLPTVKDFKSVNKRRSDYGLEPLRWPKSLAIPESKQPWLKKPIGELEMRFPTSEEYDENFKDFV